MVWADRLVATLSRGLLRRPGAAVWAAALPEVVAGCARRWSLRLGEPFPGATTSLAVAARRQGGIEAVLKIPFPDRESAHEAEALAAWGGAGAIRLLAHDTATGAMLLERCLPGTPLSALGTEEAVDVLAALLPRLWVPAGPPFRPLADEARHWAENLPVEWEGAGRPFPARLIDAAREALAALCSRPAGSPVLLHQDLHDGNVLSARREPWLVIDPKPLAGEREFGLAPIVRSAGAGGGRAAALRCLDRLSGDLGLDRDRSRLWAFAQTVAWAFEDGRALAGHIAIAQWLLDA